MRFFRITFASVLAVLVLACAAPARAIEWRKDIDTACEEAKERGAPLFIFFCQST
ncbi:MAG: hypothetical protein ACYS8W_16205 [Planctomycetota bacterium]|jgi:hypothetical protein